MSLLKTIKKHEIIILTFIVVQLSFSSIFVFGLKSSNQISERESLDILRTPKNENSYSIADNNYEATIHWVKTNITVNDDASGTVTMMVNCTPTENHIGLYLRPIEESHEINKKTSYAFYQGEELELNISAYDNQIVSHYVFLKNTSLVEVGNPILYVINYEADFFLNSQIALYKTNPELVVLSLNRPYWDVPLDSQRLRLVLPVTVADENVTQNYLDSLKIDLNDLATYYNVSFETEEQSNGKLKLVMEASKTNLDPRAPFDIYFYITKSVFNLPKVYNWAVILILSILLVAFLIIFVRIVFLRESAEKENAIFQEKIENFSSSLTIEKKEA
jgi:hypothetical protein